MSNDFQRDDKFQKDLRDRILAPDFYGKHAKGGRYVFIDKGRLATTFQKRFAVDTIVQGKNGAGLCIEEKIVRWPESNKPHMCFCLETDSCTVPGHESSGWMRYGKADFLLYCFQQQDLNSLACYLIDFPKLQAWFEPLQMNLPTFMMTDTLNRSRGRLAPIEQVCEAVPCWRRFASASKLVSEIMEG